MFSTYLSIIHWANSNSLQVKVTTTVWVCSTMFHLFSKLCSLLIQVKKICISLFYQSKTVSMLHFIASQVEGHVVCFYCHERQQSFLSIQHLVPLQYFMKQNMSAWRCNSHYSQMQMPSTSYNDFVQLWFPVHGCWMNVGWAWEKLICSSRFLCSMLDQEIVFKKCLKNIILNKIR